MQMCRGKGEEVQRCKVQRCRGDSEVIQRCCRGVAEVLQRLLGPHSAILYCLA